MTMKLLNRTIFSTLALMATGLPLTAQAADAAFDLNVDAMITSGTCTATLADASGPNEVQLGNVSMSQIKAGTGAKSFKLVFSDCAGVANALVKVTPKDGCSGNLADGDSFANNTSQTDYSKKSALEIWTTAVPADTSSVLLKCAAPNQQTVSLSSVTESTPVEWPLSARLVPAKGNTAENVTGGVFLTHTTFDITYQ